MKSKILILNGQGGSGKALPNEMLIPIPYGFKKVSDIKVGDFLLDRRGNPTKVLGVFPQGEQEVYQITFDDGRTIECSGEHLWNIHKSSWHRNKSKDKFVPYTTEQLIKEGIKLKGTQGYRFTIQNNEPIEYPEKTFNIHPYVIGAFLGDGCCTQRMLTFSSGDEEIVNKISNLIGAIKYIKRDKKGYSWIFNCEPVKNIKHFTTKKFFKNYLEEICTFSYYKRIPNEYKYSSIEQRYELLQGLFDTDGSISNRGRVSFTSTSLNLIKDVQEVLHSLGINSSLTIDKRPKYTNKNCYSIMVRMSNEDKSKLFYLSRKKNIALSLPNSTFRYDRVKIIDIKKTQEKKQMTCFYVDNDEHLFLAQDFLTTHNTTFKNFIKEYDKAQTGLDRIADTSIIDRTKSIAQMCGWTGAKEDRDRAFLHDLKILLQDYNDLPYRTVANFINQAASIKISGELVYPYIFVDAREIPDIERLVNDFDATTILIKRGQRSYGNEADDGVFNWQYDYIIENDATLEDLKLAAQFFWNEFTKPERIEKSLQWEEFEVENLKILEVN